MKALIAYRAFSDVVGKGAFLLVTVLAARRLTPYEFGVLALGSTVGWISAVTTDFGIQLHVARAVAQRPCDAADLLHRWLRIRIGTSAAWAIGLAVIVRVIGVQGRYGTAFLVLVVVYLINGLTEFVYHVYRGLSRSDVESTLTICQRSATLALATVVLVWRPSIAALAVAMLAPALVAFLFSVHLARRLSGNAGQSPRTVKTDFLQQVFPIGAGVVLSALYFRLDVLLLELWRGTEVVGAYNAVFRLVDAMRLAPAAALAVWFPTLCRADDPGPLTRLAVGLTASSAAAALLLAAIGGWLVPVLYGDTYAMAVPAFRILLLAFPLMSLNYALTTQLIGWGLHRAFAALCAAALAGNLALNSRLIPALSLDGAAWATLGTEVLLTVGSLLALAVGTVPAARTAPDLMSAPFVERQP